jgi:hypothetical protein
VAALARSTVASSPRHPHRPRLRSRRPEARLLHGKRALFKVILDSPEDTEGVYTLYGCETPDDIERTDWLCPNQKIENEMIVEATLQVLHFPKDGPFPSFTEYRLREAVRR